MTFCRSSLRSAYVELTKTWYLFSKLMLLKMPNVLGEGRLRAVRSAACRRPSRPMGWAFSPKFPPWLLVLVFYTFARTDCVELEYHKALIFDCGVYLIMFKTNNIFGGV